MILAEESVKIGIYDNYNVFLYFTNDEDLNTFGSRGLWKLMGIRYDSKMEPRFQTRGRSNHSSSLGSSSCLPLHLHTGNYLYQITKDVGTLLEMDVATRGKTRPSMAKVRVEIDVLKPLLNSVWVGADGEDSPLKRFVQ